MAVPVVLYLLLCLYYLHANRRADGGHLVYALDDPYIHLALADSIAHGHYGINPIEPSSPSSSLLWPFLLVPFARTAWFLWAPLLLNVLLGTALAAFLGWLTAAWPGWKTSPDELLRRTITGAALVFIGNLAGLAFVGMEHTAQVLLAAVAAFAICKVLAGEHIPLAALILVGLGPSIRYEAVGLVLAVSIALAGTHRYRAALLLFVASLLPLLAFSLYLHHRGLPWLPTSVLVKGGTARGNALAHLTALAVSSLKASLFQKDRLLLLVLFVVLADLVRQQTTLQRRIALGAAALAAGMHLLIGQFNWFHRYEVYIVLFATLIILYIVFESPRFLRGWYALGLLACAAPYLDGTRTLTAATEDIYLQQFQMHRFSTDFYTGNVAVNDLGLVSFHRPSGQQVVDLVGLGSAEAAQQKEKSAAWLDDITHRHHADLAMIYRKWFGAIPADWTPLGTLCLDRQPVMLSHDCVAFYATTPAALPSLNTAFRSFAQTLPAGATAYIGNAPVVGPNSRP